MSQSPKALLIALATDRVIAGYPYGPKPGLVTVLDGSAKISNFRSTENQLNILVNSVLSVIEALDEAREKIPNRERLR